MICSLVGATTAHAHSLHQPPLASLSKVGMEKKTKPTYQIAGRRWPGRTITYFDATPKGAYRVGLAAAVREWNARSLKIRFVKTRSRSAAQIIVTRDRRIGVRVAGLATVGYTPGYKGWVKLNMDRASWPDVAWVASHELGHVLGLGHSRGCTVMSYSAYTDCKFPVDKWQWRCRLQESVDVAGARRLYGGRGRARSSSFCLKHPAAGAVMGLQGTASSSRQSIATISWQRPARANSYLIARSEVNGSCVRNFRLAKVWARLSYTDSVDQTAPAGTYCYSVWARNVDGAPSALRTVSITYNPPLPDSVANLTASVQLDEYDYALVNLNWTNPANTSYVSVVRGPSGGACIGDINDPASVYIASDYQISSATDDRYDAARGATYCYSVFANDGSDAWSVPTTITVAIP